jgi:CDGSH-type Zn-finger protein
VTATITPRNNGPYVLEGEFKILGPSGNEIPHQGNRAVLCRCGGSTNKPFCDGTHTRVGFQAAEAAVEQADRQGGT